MSKQRVALYLQDAHSLQDGIKIAQYAESKGFEAVWQAESRLVRDAIVPMAAFAATTSKLKVGSGVINNWTRNIGLLAATFLTLDDLAPNRIICGIGAWWDPLAKNVGIERRNQVALHGDPGLAGVFFKYHRMRAIQDDLAAGIALLVEHNAF